MNMITNTSAIDLFKIENIAPSLLSQPLLPLEVKVTGCFWIVLGAYTSYHLLDMGLANVLGLETLIKGTGPKGYFEAMTKGGDPSYGGCSYSSSAGMNAQNYVESSKNYYYLFKDSQIPYQQFSLLIRDGMNLILASQNRRKNKTIFRLLQGGINPVLSTQAGIKWVGRTMIPFAARFHAALSGIAQFGAQKIGGKKGWALKILGAGSGLLTPSLKFRFKPEEVVNNSKFEIYCHQ